MPPHGSLHEMANAPLNSARRPVCATDLSCSMDSIRRRPAKQASKTAIDGSGIGAGRARLAEGVGGLIGIRSILAKGIAIFGKRGIARGRRAAIAASRSAARSVDTVHEVCWPGVRTADVNGPKQTTE